MKALAADGWMEGGKEVVTVRGTTDEKVKMVVERDNGKSGTHKLERMKAEGEKRVLREKDREQFLLCLCD